MGGGSISNWEPQKARENGAGSISGEKEDVVVLGG